MSQIDIRSEGKRSRRAIKTRAVHNDRIQLSKTGLGFIFHQVTKEEIGLQDMTIQVLDLVDLGLVLELGTHESDSDEYENPRSP